MSTISMPTPKKGFNPFYVLLVLLGIAFSVTACAYGLMAWRDLQGEGGPNAVESDLMAFMRRHGGLLMGVEIALLAVATFGAMVTDRFWQRRAEANDRHDAGPAGRTSTAERHDEQQGRR